MRFASIETSTEWCSVALWADGEIAALERRAGMRHSELALPMLERLLAAAGIGAGQLDAVAFGAGPGSFTGLRIACGVAQRSEEHTSELQSRVDLVCRLLLGKKKK